MRVERRNNCRNIARLRQRYRAPDDRLMAQMKPVEIAERNNRPAHGPVDRVSPEQAFHAAAIWRRPRGGNVRKEGEKILSEQWTLEIN
jgi:hypothetical protein